MFNIGIVNQYIQQIHYGGSIHNRECDYFYNRFHYCSVMIYV